jgi:hypothetical protein
MPQEVDVNEKERRIVKEEAAKLRARAEAAEADAVVEKQRADINAQLWTNELYRLAAAEAEVARLREENSKLRNELDHAHSFVLAASKHSQSADALLCRFDATVYGYDDSGQDAAGHTQAGRVPGLEV